MQSDTPSLRERRRLETWAALHEAAATAALTGDAEASSVEAIAAAAGVSTRTFFNYFASKDEAVYGYRAPELPPGAVESLDPQGDPVAQTARLLLATMRTATPQGTPARRRKLAAQFPALARFRMQALVGAEDLVLDALSTAFADHPLLQAAEQPAAGASATPQRRLQMWVALAGAVIRHATWDPHDSPGGPLTDAALQRSLDLYHQLEGPTA